jgi:hypothetical protein
MNFVAALLYPITLLLSAGGTEVGDSRDDEEKAAPVPAPGHVWVEVPASGLLADPPAGATVILPFQPEPGWQVRIEQHMQIRITPRAQAPMRRDMFFDFPDDDFKVQYIEKKMGKCLSIAGIAGVQPDRGNRLLLYMRDRRLVGAELERSCRARDFYSGFYLSRTDDGQLCVDRDTLLSRSGMNCKLTRIRQLIETGR